MTTLPPTHSDYQETSMSFSWWKLALVLLMLTAETESFSILSTTQRTGGLSLFHHESPRHRRTSLLLPRLPQASVLSLTSPGLHMVSPNHAPVDAGAARAGTAGYSLLRQPVQWDLEADPQFEKPRSWKEDDDDAIRRNDESWWTERRTRQPQQQSKSGDNAVKSSEAASPRTVRDDIMAAPEQLDLLQRSLDTLDYPRVIRALQDQCTTWPARRMIQDALTAAAFSSNKTTSTVSKKPRPKTMMTPRGQERAYQPLTADSVQGIQDRYRAVEEMEWLIPASDAMVGASDDDTHLIYSLLKDAVYRNRKGYQKSLGAPPLQGFSFALEPMLDYVEQKGEVLEGPELLEISVMLDIMEDVICWNRGLLQQTRTTATDGESQNLFVELPKIADCIVVNSTLQELLRTAFDDKEVTKLSGTTFPTIGRLRAKVKTLRADVLQKLQDFIQLPSFQSKLALESGGPAYSEINGRLVVPLNPKYSNGVGIVHDMSRSGRTAYVEPTPVVGPTNELRQAEVELQAEEARVWRYLTNHAMDQRPTLEASAQALGQLDLVMARLLLGRQLKGVIPAVQDEGVISLQNAKHPVLLLRKIQNVVGSDIDLGANGNQGLVLTGPNAGGKTVILKLLGLVALMARSGIPVPADPKSQTYMPRVDFFHPVLADIGDLQSVGGDLSTFSGHILVCKQVLENSGRNALVLMDELGSGTDPNQGVAIAQAILEALLETGARVAITTHYLELKQLAASDDRFAVAGMQFVSGRPTYKLLPGTVGESYALAVAERLELPRSVINRANELLDSETRQMGDLIRELEDQKALADQKVEELERKQRELAAMEEELKAQQAKLEQKQLVARREEAKKFAAKLEEKERVLEEILEKLKSDPSRKIVAKSWDDIKFVKRDALNEAEYVPSVMARKMEAAVAMEQASAELVPLDELRERPELNIGDTVIVCKKGALFGKQGSIAQLSGSQIEVKVMGMVVRFKLGELALPNGVNWSALSKTSTNASGRPKSLSKAAEKEIQMEEISSRRNGDSQQHSKANTSSLKSKSVAMRTESNTVDIRGCSLEEAKEKVKDKFSASLMSGRPVVYILHGHGSGGVLKTKVRNWLRSERDLVKRFEPADPSDGGDAFTRVEL